MIQLLDTHLLLLSINEPEQLSERARAAITDPTTEIVFSAVSVWEVAIKHALRKPGFEVDPTEFRDGLMEIGYEELPVSGLHAIEVAGLPRIHGDPFDRLIVAQAIVEGYRLVTADRQIARYPGPILKV